MNPDMMETSIAIVGGPQSGKSAFAIGLQESFADGPVAVIDDYVDGIMEQIDGVAGFRGNYISNLAIALGRIGLEKHAEKDHATVITVGSLLETSVYAAMTYETLQKQVDSDADKSDLLRRVEATMKTLACFYMDSFFYDFVFYCGPTGHANLADFETQFEKNLQASFQAFALVPVIPLPTEGGDLKEITDNRVKTAIANIEEANSEGDAQGSRTPLKKAV